MLAAAVVVATAAVMVAVAAVTRKGVLIFHVLHEKLHFHENRKGITAAAVVTAVMTVLISVSKEADPRESWLVKAVAVVAIGAAMHYGLKPDFWKRKRKRLATSAASK